MLNLLLHRTIFPQMANLSTQKALPGFRPISSCHSTQLYWHGIPAISWLTVEPVPSATMLPSMLRSIPGQKPYRAVCRVSSMHRIVQGSWVLHHNLLLDLWLQTALVGHQYILCRHHMPHLQHQALELLIIFHHSSSLMLIK